MDKNYELDEEGKEIEEGLEFGKSILDDKLRQELQEAARAHVAERNKNKNVTLRMTQGDLEGLKYRAEQAGIPYQTLLNVLIHQYVEGKIKIVI